MALDLPTVLVAGGGEVGSAVCHRLVRSGLGVVVVDLRAPRCLRRRVCFAMAIPQGSVEVEGVEAVRVADAGAAKAMAATGRIGVLSEDFRRVASELSPDVLVDARMTKTGEGVVRDLAPLVVGLGPGFTAGENADVIVETKRGHDLGKVFHTGSAHPDTGVPGSIMGHAEERVIRAPESGRFSARLDLGAMVERDDVVGYVEDAEVRAPIAGLLRGLVADGIEVAKGKKMGDVDPRGSHIDPATISDRGRGISGGVLEAIMNWWTAGAR
jgi:xanthine dehydrogenase accessory factor